MNAFPIKEKESVSTSVLRLQQLARERAKRQARRIPWQRLHESCTQYIDWQEFYLWVRSITESEGGIPDWLAPVLDDHCPGFLRAEHELTAKAGRARPLVLRLEDWIDEQAFAAARAICAVPSLCTAIHCFTEEGWFNAITYYAVREHSDQQTSALWQRGLGSSGPVHLKPGADGVPTGSTPSSSAYSMKTTPPKNAGY